MRFLKWLTCNWADTDDPDSDLEPLTLQQDWGQALLQVQQAIRHLTRWQVESVDEEKGIIHATRRTKLWRFVDDIHIRLESMGLGTRLHARSQSRLGAADFGQNRRNLHELWDILQMIGRLGELGGFKK